MTSVPSTAHITVYHVKEARLGFGTSHKLNMLTGMSSKQDLSRGLYGISGFLIKSPGVVCCKHPQSSWNEDLCSAGPVIERVRELCTQLWIQGSKSKTWFRHCIGRENNFQVWKAAQKDRVFLETSEFYMPDNQKAATSVTSGPWLGSSFDLCYFIHNYMVIAQCSTFQMFSSDYLPSEIWW